MNARRLLRLAAAAACAVWLACETSPNWREPLYHEVRPGETLSSIAEGYGVDRGWLASANGIRDASRVRVGTRLLIPGGGRIVHVVRPGDTLVAIAGRYGVDTFTIAQANDLADPDRIEVGQRLVMPRGARLPLPPTRASRLARAARPAAEGAGTTQAARPRPPAEATPEPSPTRGAQPPARTTTAAPAAPTPPTTAKPQSASQTIRPEPPPSEQKAAPPKAAKPRRAAPSPQPTAPQEATTPPEQPRPTQTERPPAVDVASAAPADRSRAPQPQPLRAASEDPSAADAPSLDPAQLLHDASENYLAADFHAAREQAVRAGGALQGRDDPEAAWLRAKAAFVEGSAWAGLGDDARAVEAFARSRRMAPAFEPPTAWMSPRLQALYERTRIENAGADRPPESQFP